MFKLRDDELTFSKAVEIAQEMEEAAKVAKETIHGSSETPSTSSVYKMSDKKKPPSSGFKLSTKRLSFHQCHLSFLPEERAPGVNLSQEKEKPGVSKTDN